MEFVTNKVYPNNYPGFQEENFAIFIPYGNNRDPRYKQYCEFVWKFFDIRVNFVECPFPVVSHGWCLNQVIKKVIESAEINVDHVIFAENDSVPLQENILETVLDFVKNRKTLFGICQNSGHKKAPDGGFISPYVGPAFAAFSVDLYKKLSPDFDHHTDRADTLEEFSYKVKESGNIISLIYPSEVKLRNCQLDAGCSFGMGNKYSDLIYHASQCNNPESVELFVNVCKEIIGEK